MFRSKKQYWRNAIAALVLVLGLMTPTTTPLAKSGGKPKVVPSMQAVQRPLSDFLNAQGTTSIFNCCAPAVPDYIGWTRPFATPPADQRLALVDYAGVANGWLVGNGYPSLGTTFGGSIHERPLPDGRAEVTVILHTRNALAYLVPFDLRAYL